MRNPAGRYGTTLLFMAAAQKYAELLVKLPKVEDTITSTEHSHDHLEYKSEKPSRDLSGGRRVKAHRNLIPEDVPCR